jgi:hypothetical protein
MNLGFQELLELATAAGFVGNDANIAAAIALAESNGNPDCIGDTSITPPYGSIGLWQINVRWHPEFEMTNLKSPMYNAECAFRIYTVQRNSFCPWSTYNSGAYQKYMPTQEVAQ